MGLGVGRRSEVGRQGRKVEESGSLGDRERWRKRMKMVTVSKDREKRLYG